VGNDAQYVKFCKVANIPDLGVNPLFARNRDRVQNRAQLVPILESVMKLRTKADWLDALEAAKVPCGAINNLAEVFTDPQIEARGMVTHWPHPLRNDLPLVASPLKLSATPVRTPGRGGLPPPLLGQHTEEVLREVLNYSDLQLLELKNTEVT
jgi:crotonobetainyl-CoA:carnitine CoA-transferase CaiB-like acyl-CoA transferase